MPLASAASALVDRFGVRSADEYLAGKTRFRDALYDRFGLSELEAEELCDALEGDGWIRFLPPEGDDDASWVISAPTTPDRLAPRR